MPFARLISGGEDGQWFAMEGVVRSGHTKGTRLFLDVATVDGSFIALMPDFPPDWNRKLVDARVVMRGVLAAISYDRRQSAGLRMFVPGADLVQIKAAAPPDVFNLQLAQAVSVGQFHPLDQLERRIRVRASVVAAEPGLAMYVADATGNLEIQSVSGCAARTGDLLDVVGFPGVVEGRPGLQDALCRKVGNGISLRPATVNAEKVIPPQVRADPFGLGYASGTRYDGSLIRTEGILLGSSYQPEAATLLLRCGAQSFTATLPASRGQKLPQWESGSRLRLTGICLESYDRYHRSQFFRILLRSSDDVVLLLRPSWWTLRHSIGTLCLLAAACMAAAAWIWVLRHQVAMQTRQLRIANERLTELSTRDPLTHACNRRRFDQILDAELQRMARSGRPLSLILLDIDHFKSLNDIYGHQKGDDCLIRVVRALELSVHRSADAVARYGGEEFTIILPETNHEGALQLAEAARAAVAALAMPHPASPTQPFVTISAGVTTVWPGTEPAAGQIIETADRALYEAKRMGRNRIAYMEICADALRTGILGPGSGRQGLDPPAPNPHPLTPIP